MGRGKERKHTGVEREGQRTNSACNRRSAASRALCNLEKLAFNAVDRDASAASSSASCDKAAEWASVMWEDMAAVVSSDLAKAVRC